jgi:D-alanyl-D-alanine carboxypeptidase
MTIARRVLFLFAILSLLLPAGAAQETDLQKRLQARLDELLEKGGYPGLTAAISMPDGRLLVTAAGYSNPETKIAMKPTDRMLAGSVGKTFVAAAILQAVDDGTLDLDSKIERWLGREPWFNRIPNARSLTLRLLLSHRTGIPDPTEDAAFRKAFVTDIERKWSAQERVQWILDKKPKFAPGQKFLYSDLNYVVAGLVFESATGRKLFGEIERRILKPFGLDQTLPTENGSMDNVIPGELDPTVLRIRGQSIRGGRFVYNAAAEYGGGGIISTSGDLARWAKLLWEGKVFSRALLDQMLDAKPAEQGMKYGLGVAVVQSEAGPCYLHDGWIPGYQTAMVYFPEYKVSATLQLNADPLKRFKVPFDLCIGRIAGVALKDMLTKKAGPAK